MSYLHEVSVPLWPEDLAVAEVMLLQIGLELDKAIGVVLDGEFMLVAV